MVWLMVLNKDRPLRKEDWSTGAYKSQGFSEAGRRWEGEKSIQEWWGGCRTKQWGDVGPLHAPMASYQLPIKHRPNVLHIVQATGALFTPYILSCWSICRVLLMCPRRLDTFWFISAVASESRSLHICNREFPYPSTLCWKAFSHLQKWKFLWSERGELYRWISENILEIAICRSDYMTFWINAGACRRLCHSVTDWTRSNGVNCSAVAGKKPLLLCCGPFLRSSTSRRSENGAQRQTDLSGLVWTRSGAHDWGLCTAQLQHKWIFTWLCYPFSFLPNQVSTSLVALCDRNGAFCCEWHALLNVLFYFIMFFFFFGFFCALQFARCAPGWQSPGAAAHCFCNYVQFVELASKNSRDAGELK